MTRQLQTWVVIRQLSNGTPPSGSSHQLFCLAKLVGIWIQLAESLNWLLHLPRQLLTLQSWLWPQPRAQREVDLGQSLLLI